MPNNPALIILIKNPIPGKTKTRLAATVGNDMALKMYGMLTDWTRDQALGLGEEITRYLYYSDFVPETDKWPSEKFRKEVQKGNDLGERMTSASLEVFQRGHDAVILIGSDCPGITTDYLRTSFAALSENDVVIGPALDGGYTLIGTQQPAPQLFTEMEWSTERVLADTLHRISDLGLSVTEQERLSDVDYLHDWHAYGWALPTS